MTSTAHEQPVDQEHLDSATPSESTFFLTVLPLTPSAPPFGELQVTAAVRNAITDLLHTGGWITLRLDETDGAYLAALPESNIQASSDIDSVIVITATDSLNNPQASPVLQATISALPLHPGNGHELTITFRNTSTTLSISGETAKEASLAGSSQIDSTTEDVSTV